MNRGVARISIPSMLAVAIFGLSCGGGGASESTPDDSADSAADTVVVIDPDGQAVNIISSGGYDPPPRWFKPRGGANVPEDAVQSIPPDRAHELMARARPPWYLLDVRTSAEYVQIGYIEGAVLGSIERLEENIHDLGVRTDQTVLVYGDDDPRALEAARLLIAYGFPSVRILEGGLPAWQRAGLPVEKRP